jgi:hypothetical protein
MGQEMKLSSCVNGYFATQSDMPSWGQLGCNGFIVLDSSHKVVTTATSPYLQVRELAFGHVEALVESLLRGDATMPSPCPGQSVRITGLQGSTELNGEVGLCTAPPPAAAAAVNNGGEEVVPPRTAARCVVQLRSGRSVKLLPANVRVLGEDGEELEPVAADDDCGAGG